MTEIGSPRGVSAEQIAARAERVRDRIRGAGGDPSRVTIVAVTKAFGMDVLRGSLSAGLVEVGENYARELADKASRLEPEERARARFHFVGRLQRNKVRLIAPHVHLWQSVDRAELGDEIARRAPGAAVLVQVNATAEPQKGGCPPDEVAALVEHLRGGDLEVRGLMAVGRAGDERATGAAFEAVSRLADSLDLIERSMGMTDDIEIAVGAGTTMVRVGRELFGDRPPRDLST